MTELQVTYADALPATADVVVIGGGILGAATAFWAQQAGLHTVVVERRNRLCALTTPAATGAFRLQFDNPEEIALVRSSIEFFAHFNEAAGIPTDYDIGVKRQGYLWLTRTTAGTERHRHLVAKQHEWGLDDVELLGQAEVEKRFPYLVKGEILSARFRQGDGFIDQKRLTMGLAAGSKATFVLNCNAKAFVVNDNMVRGVETEKGTIFADHIVIAAGPFSGEVARLAGLELPLEPRIRQKLVMPHVPYVPQSAAMTIDDDTGSHWRPALNGAYLIYTDPSTPVTPPMDNVPAEQSYYDTLLDPSNLTSVGHLSPFWREVWARNDYHWFVAAGQYTYSPDHRPLLGPLSVKGLYLNTGYSGHGVMASVAGSRLVIDTIVGKMPPHENAFRPDREMHDVSKDLL